MSSSSVARPPKFTLAEYTTSRKLDILGERCRALTICSPQWIATSFTIPRLCTHLGCDRSGRCDLMRTKLVQAEIALLLFSGGLDLVILTISKICIFTLLPPFSFVSLTISQSSISLSDSISRPSMSMILRKSYLFVQSSGDGGISR